MAWFLLTLACIILWGVADVLFKASLDQNDPLSQHKTFIWVGIIMAVAGFIMSTRSDTLLNSLKILKNDVLYLIPLCLVYAMALFFGLLGQKHLYASIVSPLENIEGALSAIIIYFYYLITGLTHPEYTLGAMDVIASVAIIIGVILLGRQEQAMMRQEALLSDDKKKHRYGALALFLPIIYTLVDVFSVAEIGGIYETDATAVIPPIDFFVFECLGFALVALCMWIYLLIVKKYKYNPFQPEEMIRCGAATGETFGTMTFLFAAASKPVITAPITSSYFIVTIVLARIFLKERLTKKQYISLAFVVFGIVLFGISEIIKA